MVSPELHHLSCPGPAGTHRMAWWQWGAADAPRAVICVHGMTRQGRDFDVLAQALVAAAGGRLRVVCPDVAGRGHSDWLPEPMHYAVPTYVADMLALIGTLHSRAPLAAIDWVGTSMGGLIAMGLFGTQGLPLAAPLRRLVLNDVGPQVEWAAIERIKSYVGLPATYASLEQAATIAEQAMTSFGPHTREQWLALTRHQLRALPLGGFTSHYDPRIAQPLALATEEDNREGAAVYWALYDRIEAPTLLTRGAQSDLLSAATAQAMSQRGPRAQVIEFAGVGHAPTFVPANQVQAVVDFLSPG